MRNLNRKVDIFFLALIIEIFVLTTIFVTYEKINMQNYFMFEVSFLLLVISFYTNVVIGLLMSLFAIFIYGNYVLYEYIKGVITNFNYLWLVIFPILSVTAGKLGDYINQLEKNQKKLEEEIIDLVRIDEVTNLNNKKSFYIDLEEEMSRARRHNFHLTIMILKIQYFDELLSIYGRKKVNKILKDIAKKIELVTRVEDKRYCIGKDSFGIIMPNTKFEGAEIVKIRLIDELRNISLKYENKEEILTFHFKVGIVEYDKKIEDPFVVKDLVEKEIEYDI
ncbi:diguanylate cyclase [Crassaminicella thermophila]|uniref:Diguanylate cyclase n=1 Tax=Crassaminicella thermophila TaxID=2599308 RepID=A0A5C0SH91_CRATE|nr:diguanylate cyclase [Crassaminicella thermophila]QEK12784.1 diguanylate cyclase [Crassaminicella thermophila]